MAQTITQKILARAANRKFVNAGENVWLNVDILLTHDVCGPPTFDIFKEKFGPDAKVWDPEKVVVLPDHYIFTENEHAHRNIDLLRTFAAEQNLPNYYDVGTDRYKGVCHVALAQEGFNLPGTVLFGTDSHTCTSGAFGMFGTGIGNTDAAFILGTGKLWEKVPESMKFVFDGAMPDYLTAKDLILQILGDIGTDGATYRAMEFDGSAVYQLPVEERMTLTNMAIEAGGMNGIIAADEVTEAYVKARTSKPYEIFHSDPDAIYHSIYHYNVEELEPVVAQPHSPDNRATVRSVQGTRITKSYIGSCTGGKLSDFKMAAKILNGQQVSIQTNIVPATVEVAKSLETEQYEGKSIRKVLEDAGCTIAQPSCAACLGGPADTFGRSEDNDLVVSTTNRNFPGRMGSKKAGVYLASPLTAAASAITGRLTDPREFLS
ncbi:MAG: 3-isopropylmalate dehydratase large subunit [Prosthecochloris sp.]|uniref:Homoaconitate hydratase family protein n=1 Tax=Prosthecochloris aestuarii (strain DSM 271 / SK 413) TaxID=290512 RepID=B4S6N0_PROA2|nr:MULTISPECIES: 3-isopropylmalate dehydratase large subunit [Prosthecochloris]ACF45785.1 homoaconitate hydratase family protein [Prosthecochloris aestuarii DSM 271]MCW8799190.1 3-isopropylmalate dehydratase large subunit [Prosthecochloris sp.]NEX12163.1 3-isopropylmalate dehydratase large subunit [Prosthecochloris sp.]RDD30698.1 3-isopropylmalate dehydratase large subunit [Prosthecochloris sp. ZM]